MCVKPKKTYIFIHVPKCGGTSLRVFLETYAKDDDSYLVDRHRDILEVINNFNDEFELKYPVDDYFKFGLVRNPWSRTVSLYNRNEYINNVKNNINDNMTFPEFVEWINYSTDNCHWPSKKKNQLDFFTDEKGKVLVDYIGKFEEIDVSISHIAKKLGISDFEIPHRNFNPRNTKHYSEYYTPKTKEIIYRKFIKDIEYFGYNFK